MVAFAPKVIKCAYDAIKGNKMRRLRRRTRKGVEVWVDGWMGGLQKLITFFSGWAGLQKLITDLDMKNGYKGGVRVGFIYIKDMYNNDVGKGGV